jgi:TPR repeat protein
MAGALPMRLSLFLAMIMAWSAPAWADALQDGTSAYQRGDYTGALDAWKPLADKGNALAQNNLGILYLDGAGVAQSLPQAVHYLSLSAASGSALGQNNLGGLYRDGKGVKRDYARALQWFSASAAQGNASAMYNLGLMQEQGQGIKPDTVRAYMWYVLAAEKESFPNAVAHRDALGAHMTIESQKEARELASVCKKQGYKGCR